MAEPAAIRERLLRRLSELERRTQRIAKDLRRPGDPDSEERATQRENDEVLAWLDDAETREMARIRETLERLDDGRYGTCARCAEPIGRERLAALPFTDVCITCAEAAGSA